MTQPHIEQLTTGLKEQLPALATELIEKHADMAHPANQTFAAQPNDPAEHAPEWHQFGIVEHSERFHDSMKSTVMEYVEQWGLGEQVDAALETEVDGVPKRDLLSVTALLHDIGKFTGRKMSETADGTQKQTFEDHEAESGRVIREAPVNDYLIEHGLTEAQIEYIARTAELHFELGKLRRVAKLTEGGYTMAFTETPEFEAAISQIIEEHPDFALEIGLQFIADAMSKSDHYATGETDAAIEAARPNLEQSLAKKGLNKELLAQALQVPINLKVAEKYLQRWART